MSCHVLFHTVFINHRPALANRFIGMLLARFVVHIGSPNRHRKASKAFLCINPGFFGD